MYISCVVVYIFVKCTHLNYMLKILIMYIMCSYRIGHGVGSLQLLRVTHTVLNVMHTHTHTWYYEMSYGLNVEMHQQVKLVVKECMQQMFMHILPYLLFLAD